MKSLKRLRNKSGVSLIEVIAASGLLGVMILGMVQLTTFMNQGTSRVRLAQDFEQLSGILQANLSQEAACSKALQGTVFSDGGAISFPAIEFQSLASLRLDNGSAATSLQSGTIWNNTLYIKTVKLVLDTAVNSTCTPTSSTSCAVKFSIDVEDNSKSTAIKTDTSRRGAFFRDYGIVLYFKLDSTGVPILSGGQSVIDRCSAKGSEAAICEGLGGQYRSTMNGPRCYIIDLVQSSFWGSGWTGKGNTPDQSKGDQVVLPTPPDCAAFAPNIKDPPLIFDPPSWGCVCQDNKNGQPGQLFTNNNNQKQCCYSPSTVVYKDPFQGGNPYEQCETPAP